MNWNVEDALDAQYDRHLDSLETDVEPTDEEPFVAPDDDDWPDDLLGGNELSDYWYEYWYSREMP